MGLIAITGAAGAVGSVLAPRLAAAGYRVQALTRQDAPLPSTDWYDPGAPAEALIHLAADSHARAHRSAAAVTAQDTAAPHLEMLAALIAKGWRGHLIFASSAAVYAGSDQPIPETAAPAPPNAYGAAKLAVEIGFQRLAAAYHLPLTLLRPANIYGTAQDLKRKRVTGLLIDAAKRGESFRVFGDGRSQRDYLYIDDLAEAVRIVLKSRPTAGRAQIFNLGSGTGTSLESLIGLVEAATGLPIQRDYQPAQAEAAACVLDISHARAQLNWSPSIPLDIGLKRLIAGMHHDGRG